VKIETKFQLQPLAPVAGLSPEHQQGLLERGVDIIDATLQVAEKYLLLAKYVRDHKLPPKQVREVLSYLGFNKVRISEINRVANVPDDMWSEMEVKQMSFRKALDASRGRVREVLQVEDVSAEQPKLPGTEDSPDDKKKTAAARAAKQLLGIAEHFGWKSKTYKNGSEWTVTVTRSKAKKEAQ